MRRLLFLLALVAGCGRVPTFTAPLAPSEQYAWALAEAGLDSTRLGRAWVTAGADALADPPALELPATLSLDADGVPVALARRLELRQGEVLQITAAGLADSARVFVDLFAADSSRARLGGWAAGPDTLRAERPVARDQAVVLRLWPELLAEGAVSVRVQAAPSLVFPVAGVGADAIQSRWGAPRDGGARRHEGVDVFADRGTPVVAAAAGRVTRVQETPIGGRVVWLRPDAAPVSLYYAHLDRQRVAPGARGRRRHAGHGRQHGQRGHDGAAPPLRRLRAGRRRRPRAVRRRPARRRVERGGHGWRAHG